MSEPLYFIRDDATDAFFSQNLTKLFRRMGFEFTVRRCVAPGHTDWLDFTLYHVRGFSFTVVTTTERWSESADDVMKIATQARPLGLIQ